MSTNMDPMPMMMMQNMDDNEDKGMSIGAKLLIGFVILVVLFLIIYGSLGGTSVICTWPFGTISDKCSCKSTGGTWDADKELCTCKADLELSTTDPTVGQCVKKSIPCTGGQTRSSSGTCTCSSTQDFIGGACVAKCASNQLRDTMGVCQLSCPSGKVSNGLACVDDLSGNWLGFSTSNNTSTDIYKWNIKHTTGGVAIYSGTTLKTTIPFDGTTLMWGTIKGTWIPAQNRITWSNDSHWIRK